jgi:uncharacterized protein YkwD
MKTNRRSAIALVLIAIALVSIVTTIVIVRMTGDADRLDVLASSTVTGSPSSTRSLQTAGPTSTPTPTAEPPVAAPPAPEGPEAPAPPEPPAPTCTDDVLVCVNLARAANGLGGLAANATLDGAAQACADRMAASAQMTHSAGGPGGFSAWGENIAYGYPSAAAVFDGWMNSEGHRANILNPAYTQMGIGYAAGNWWCQQFGG